jgi:flagellar hook-basal body complex protein FliE
MMIGIQPVAQSPLTTESLKGLQVQVPLVAFDSLLAQAMNPDASVAAASSGASKVSEIKHSEEVISDRQWLISQSIQNVTPAAPTQNPVDPVDYYNESIEPALTPQNINDEGLRTSKLSTTPFQFFLDKGIDYFRRISGMERRSDQLMEKFARGEASIEELTIEKAKVSVAISFAVTLVTQVTQAFNELKNMQV